MNAIKLNILLYADAWLLRVIFAFIQFFKPKIITMEDLDQKLVSLLFGKFDIKNDVGEGHVEALITAGIRLERARVGILALNPDADFVDAIGGLIDIADIFDTADLSPEDRAKLETGVGKLLKITSPEKVAVATELFLGVLDAGADASSAVEYFDENLPVPE